MIVLYILAALAAGFGIPVQAGVNGRLRESLSDPAWAALVSISVSFIFLLAYVTIRRLPWPFSGHPGSVPWWGWTGGIFGALFVLAALILTPKLGAGLAFSLLVSGQLTASLVLDQWGLLGLPIHHLNSQRLLGVTLLVGGVALVRAF